MWVNNFSLNGETYNNVCVCDRERERESELLSVFVYFSLYGKNQKFRFWNVHVIDAEDVIQVLILDQVQVRRPEKVRTVQRVKKTVLVKQVVPVKRNKPTSARRASRAQLPQQKVVSVETRMEEIQKDYGEITSLPLFYILCVLFT